MNFNSFTIYVFLSAVFLESFGQDLMTNLQDVEEKEFNSPIETVQFILRVLEKGFAIPCDTYTTFFQDFKPDSAFTSSQITHDMKPEYLNRGKYVWKIAEILLKTACMNKKYINSSMPLHLDEPRKNTRLTINISGGNIYFGRIP